MAGCEAMTEGLADRVGVEVLRRSLSDRLRMTTFGSSGIYADSPRHKGYGTSTHVVMRRGRGVICVEERPILYLPAARAKDAKDGPLDRLRD